MADAINIQTTASNVAGLLNLLDGMTLDPVTYGSILPFAKDVAISTREALGINPADFTEGPELIAHVRSHSDAPVLVLSDNERAGTFSLALIGVILQTMSGPSIDYMSDDEAEELTNKFEGAEPFLQELAVVAENYARQYGLPTFGDISDPRD